MEFPTPKEFAAMRKADAERGQQARLLADTSDPVEPGNFYTVTRSFDDGDGSWTDDFWEVVTVNGSKAFVRIHTRHGEKIERFCLIENRGWYLANDAWAARTQPTEDV